MISALGEAEDAAIPGLIVDKLQHSLDIITNTILCVGLTVYTTKTVTLNASSLDVPSVSAYGKQTKNKNLKVDLNLSSSGDLPNEMQRCIHLASSVLGRNLTIHTKIAVYNAVVISSILCG